MGPDWPLASVMKQVLTNHKTNILKQDKSTRQTIKTHDWLWGDMQRQTSKRSRLLIGPACLPLLTVVVMLPAAAAAMKSIWRCMQGKCIDLPPHSAPAAGPPTTANEQSISLRCLWGHVKKSSPVTFQHLKRVILKINKRQPIQFRDCSNTYGLCLRGQICEFYKSLVGNIMK